MSRQKQAGTREETRVVDWLRGKGWLDPSPHPQWPRRIENHGGRDMADVLWCPGVVVEVKHRRTSTSNAGLGQPGARELAGWMNELAVEVENSRSTLGWLIVKRSGTTDVSQWWAYIPMDDLAYLLDGDVETAGTEPACMTVAATMLPRMRDCT